MPLKEAIDLALEDSLWIFNKIFLIISIEDSKAIKSKS